MEINLQICGAIGDCIWQLSILPNIKEVCPNSYIRLFISQNEDLTFLVDGLYDELKRDPSFPSMFFLHSPWSKYPFKHLIDLLPKTLEHYFSLKFENYYKMPYSRLFVEDFHPKEFYIYFCVKTSDKDPLHPRNPPIQLFYDLIKRIPDQTFVQVGNVEDDKIDLPNVIDKRAISFKQTALEIANAGLVLGLQSGLRVLAESFYTPFICFHNPAYSVWDIPLTKNNTYIIKGDTNKSNYKEVLKTLRYAVYKTNEYFEKSKKIKYCHTISDIDNVKENSSIAIYYNNLDLELYAKRMAVDKKIKVLLYRERYNYKRSHFLI